MDTSQRSTGKLYAPLSKREQDILALLAQDLTDREIGARLFLAHTTVRWYNRQIYNKLGVENRVQAVEHAKVLGLLAKPTTIEEASLSSKYNLPAQLTPFFGRERELESLTRLLSHPHTRLLTLLAPGGMGKTRLALAVAKGVLPHFTDGLFFVPLAPLTSSEQLIPAIAAHIGIQFASDNRTPEQQLTDYLRHKKILLILDNFEHLLDGATLLHDLLLQALQLQVLVTSRTRLSLSSEEVFPLLGLETPEGDDFNDPMVYSSIQLFVDRARQTKPDFALAARDFKSLARLCRLSGGMPLVLVMAAAWIELLTINQLVTEMERNLDLLETEHRDVPERQRSIRAVFDYAWSQLTEGERNAFMKLSVFRGGFSHDAANIVAEASLKNLFGLVQAALVHTIGEGRYDIHELLRQYTEEALETVGNDNSTREAHMRYFGQYVHRWCNALKTPEQLLALDLLALEWNNIRAAFLHAIETHALDVLEQFADLWLYFEIRGGWIEGEKLFREAIATLEGQDSVALGKLLAARSVILHEFSILERDLELAYRSITILQQYNASQESWLPLWSVGRSILLLKGAESAAPILREALEVAQQYNDQWGITASLFFLGRCLQLLKQFDEAKALLTQAYHLANDTGNAWGLAHTLSQFGFLAGETKDYQTAKRFFDEGLEYGRKLQAAHVIIPCLWGLYDCARGSGELLLAKQQIEEIVRILRDIERKRGLIDALAGSAEIALALDKPAEARAHLYEALNLFRDSQPSVVLYLLMIIAVFLTHAGAKVAAVEVLSFILHDPKMIELPRWRIEELQTLRAQLQADLSPITYTFAYEHGKMMVLDKLLSRLQDLIALSNTTISATVSVSEESEN
jgi:predicted ATPase/DNA-binding CsgD family transcriptional regulator